MTSLDKDQLESPIHRENVDGKDAFSYRSGSPEVDEGTLPIRRQSPEKLKYSDRYFFPQCP